MKPALIGLLPLSETTNYYNNWYSMEFYGNQWEKGPFLYFFYKSILINISVEKIELSLDIDR